MRRYGLDEHDRDGHVRGVIEAQMMTMALHSAWMGVEVDTIHATGGAAANREILQVMADVFGADVYQFEVGNSASLGAALRAAEADAAVARPSDAMGRGRCAGWPSRSRRAGSRRAPNHAAVYRD